MLLVLISRAYAGLGLVRTPDEVLGARYFLC